MRKELEFFNLKVTSKGVEGLCSPNLVVACKLEDEEGGGDKVRIACIDRLYNFKYKRFLFYLWIHKAKIPNYEATSLKRGMFQHVIVRRTLKYIPMTCIVTSDLNLVWEDFEIFYNLIKSNNTLESHVTLLYPNLTYFLQSWSNQKTQGCISCRVKSNTFKLLKIKVEW